jgi:hypothetical protein
MMYVGIGVASGSTACERPSYHTRAMRYRPAALAACLLITAAAPAVAPGGASAAPAIRVDRPCYADPSLREDRVHLSGSGFTPQATYQVTLDGRELPGGTGQVGATGRIDGSFAAPDLSMLGKGVGEHVYELGVHQVAEPGADQVEAPVISAATQFGVSRLSVAFRPARGDPGSLRVTYRMQGFSLGGRVTPSVYVHWIAPDGRLRRTARVGTALGPCGEIRASTRRRLFPFQPERGRWRLQFDTSRHFRKGHGHSGFLYYAIPVAVTRLR